MTMDSIRGLLDEIPDFIYFHDLNGRFLQVNAALKRLLGYEEETLLGLRIPEFIHPNFRDQFDDYLSEVISKGRSMGTVVVADESGKTHVLEYHSKLIVRDGKPIGVRGMARDISEQERLKRELEDREELYRTLFENSRDAIFLMEGECFIDCNPMALKMFGCGKKDIIQSPPYHFSPEYQPDGMSSREKALDKIHKALIGIPQNFEWRHSRLDGTPFDTIVSLFRIEVQKKKLLVAMVHDITQQKESIKAIESSERKYRELVENANVAIIRFRPDGIFNFINRYGEKLFGFSREELIGKKTIFETIITEVPETDFLHDICELPECYYENENRNVTKDGRELYIAWRNQPIKDKEGNVREIMSIGADITKVKKLENELLQAKKLEAIGTLAGGLPTISITYWVACWGISRCSRNNTTPETHITQYLVKLTRQGQGRRTWLNSSLPFQGGASLNPTRSISTRELRRF